MAPKLGGNLVAALRRTSAIACRESIQASCVVDSCGESPCMVVVSSTCVRIVVVASVASGHEDNNKSSSESAVPAIPHRIVTLGGVEGLGGTVVAVCASATHWGTASFGMSSLGHLLVALGTSLGVVRVLLVDLLAECPLVQVSTRALSDDGGSHDSHSSLGVVSMCFALSHSWTPESLFVATSHGLYGFDVQEWRTGLENPLRFDSATAQSSPPSLRRVHSCTRNRKLGAAVKLLSPCTRQQVSRRMASDGGNEYHAVADGAVAAVLVSDDGTVQYVTRFFEQPIRRFASERVTYAYHLGPAIIAARRCSASSVVVVHDAQWIFNDTLESLDIVLCGVELSKPNSPSGNADVLSTSSGVWWGGHQVSASSQPGAAPLARLPSMSSMGAPYPSQSFLLSVPPLSQIGGVESYGPYGAKDPWWGRLVGVLRFSHDDGNLGQAPVGSTALGGNDAAAEATLRRWAASASWEAGSSVVSRTSSSFGGEQRGFSSAAVAGSNEVVVFLAGSDLVGVQLSPNAPPAAKTHPNFHFTTATATASNTPQVWYSFASAPMFCHPIQLHEGKSPFFAVGMDETVLFFAQQQQ